MIRSAATISLQYAATIGYPASSASSSVEISSSAVMTRSMSFWARRMYTLIERAALAGWPMCSVRSATRPRSARVPVSLASAIIVVVSYTVASGAPRIVKPSTNSSRLIAAPSRSPETVRLMVYGTRAKTSLKFALGPAGRTSWESVCSVTSRSPTQNETMQASRK